QVKPREKYLAVVPSDDAEAFEKLRKDLDDKQVAIDQAENAWRRAMRCEAHGGDECSKAKASGIAYKEYQDARDAAAKAYQKLSEEFNVIALNAVGDYWKFPFTRGVVGVDMSAPTSRTVKQSYFVDFDLLAPLRP